MIIVATDLMIILGNTGQDMEGVTVGMNNAISENDTEIMEDDTMRINRSEGMIVAMSGVRKDNITNMAVITTRYRPEGMTEASFMEMKEVRVGAMTVGTIRAETMAMKVERTIKAVGIDACI